MDTLSIATLNLWNRSRDWDRRLPVIRDQLAELSPDLIGLQEVLRLSDGDLRIDQAQALADGLGYEVAYAAAHEFGGGLTMGNALLSRHPITEQRTLPHPDRGLTDYRSAALFARVSVRDQTVPVFVVHLTWRLHHVAVRLDQIRHLLASVDELVPLRDGGFPPIVLGDLNAEPDSDEIRVLTGLTPLDDRGFFWADAWRYGGDGGPGYTFDRRNPNAALAHEPPRRIDYIFVRGPDRRFRGEPLRTRVVFDRPASDGGEWVWPSDHFGVYTEVAFAPREA